MIYAVNIVNDHKICDRVSSPIAHGSVCLKMGIVGFKLPKKMPYMEVYDMFGQIQIFKYYVVGYELYIYI